MAQNGASTLANGNRKPANNPRSDAFSLPGIDENELRARIYAKPQLKPNPRALRFSGPTPVQLKKVSLNVFHWAYNRYIPIDFKSRGFRNLVYTSF